MIALLGYSINLSANNTYVYNLNISTGDVVYPNDSVIISYNDLRLANSKLIELEYEKQINNTLRCIIANDSVIIQDYQSVNNKLNKSYKKIVRQRNITFCGVVVLFFTTVITLLIK